MTRLHLGVFDILTPNQMTQGLWAHPRNESHRYNTLPLWIEIAQLLERGKFDFIFFADSYGYPENKPELALREAVYAPVADPMLILSALAAATTRLGFVTTASPTFEQPFANARRFSTLDHLSGGRIGWNVVASGGSSAAKAFGRSEAPGHAERYEQADEFLEASYKLLEGSWEDGAVLRDKERRIFADASKVHVVRHEGRYFKLEASHACEPSPQRTPVLFQAGSSERGRDFAAKHAEGVFLKAPTIEALREQAADIRRRAEAHGRDPRGIKIFSGLSAVVGRTREEAARKKADYRAYRSREAALLTYENATGIDLASLDPDAPFAGIRTERGRSHTERYTRHSGGVQTAGQVADNFADKEFRGIRLCGTPEDIADGMQEWAEAADIDGFNLERYLLPDTLRDFVELVVPVLQQRGLFRREYEADTLRERLFGPGRRKLPDDHPGAAFRRQPSPDAR
ncbi:LLM class flavin-dependent oxidoreductase [Saccharibacillus sp. CPCC 101409]|uniref:LLM class flavin-dependent oxidoreductase n=1 Tax=Saccharibacillus sp. CPCC 101409 TaxID=3058041 RepID=UPI002671ACA3|nr:LLM class flavin-dependent oxidoreductase [Saccharibacillus sp. CPCC 101409]MDO3408247.1 LLM class flavin-dependent oxidoreductase [Saccharibacillus sp. CPCC 101409]